MSDLKELRTEALRLPEQDRAALAAALLDSLPMTGFAEEALVDTARSRYNDIATGDTQPVSWETFAAMLKNAGHA
jgi:putative addiction module component (TIGR02574 family)